MIKELRNEIDMLQDCINCMCVTDDSEELATLYSSAEFRLERITLMNLERLMDEELK